MQAAMQDKLIIIFGKQLAIKGKSRRADLPFPVYH
jgi:hypothetical protein